MNSFVAFSGGVDSTALALLEADATPVFTDTGAEPDEVYEHLDKFESATGRKIIRLKSKHGSLLDYIVKQKFMPGHGSRYCTRIFKIAPLNEFIKDHLPARLMIGLRADEPESLRVGNLTNMNGMEIDYPLRSLNMGRLDVLRVCIDHGLLPRYPPYMARGGCINCFYKRRSEVTAMIIMRPQTTAKLREIEEGVQDFREKDAFMFPNTGMSIRDLENQVHAQGDLFDPEEVYQSALDESDKGINCGLFCHR